MAFERLLPGSANDTDRQRFIRTNVPLLLLWPLAALVLAAIGWGTVLSGLSRSHEEAERHALAQAQTLSKVYADYLAQTVDTIDQLMLHIRYEWGLSEGLLPLESIKETGILSSPEKMYIAVVDATGEVQTSTIPVAEDVFVGDRPYFQAQQSSGTDSLYIGGPAVGRLSDRNVIHFSRKLIDSDGSFGGVVLAAVNAEYFATIYDETTLGKFGFLGIVGSDRIVRVTRVGPAVFPPEGQALRTSPRFDADSGATFLSGGQWFTDERSRYVGWHKVSDRPLIAVIGLYEEHAMAPYYAYRSRIISNAAWATAALALLTTVAMLISLRLAWKKYQVEMAHTTYRIATEEGNEGFYIARPIRDTTGYIFDFEFVDSNHQGASFFRKQREQVIGRRVSYFYRNESFRAVLERLIEAMERGVYESEIEVNQRGPIKVQWLHVKIVRSDGHLAVRLRDITEAKAHVEALERRGNEDALTGLPNRHWVNTYLPQATERARVSNTMLALLFIDLDGFKAVNDTLGHDAGDELLRNAGRRLKLAVRPADHVVRIGGDEFVVILEHINDRNDAAHVAERVLHAFQEGFKLSQGLASVGTSIGISCFPDDGQDANTLLKAADIAMYSVKTSGKRSYRFYEERYYAIVRERHEKEAELRHAIEHDQFVMYYQPRIDMSNGLTSSMEALIRWAHPLKGLLEPLEFIPLAEETGIVTGLGELVIDKVCAQIAFWSRTGQQVVPVSINVSPRQFNESDIVSTLSAALAHHHVNPRLVEIELTESSMMGQSERATKALAALQEMGVRLSIDDFGTGYSSLSQLQQLDVDVLKVDRAFTANIDRTEQGNVFYKAIITMAHALGMRVVAEGVENEQQVRILKALQCDEIQGFYISRPLPPTDLQPVLPRQRLPSTPWR